MSVSNKLLRQIAIKLATLSGNTMPSRSFTSNQLLESILISVNQLGSGTSQQNNNQPLINVEIITSDKQLQNTDAEIQDLTNPNSTELNLLLPPSPIVGKSFLFINEFNSIGNLFTNNTVIRPDDRYRIVWNGNRWLEI